MDWLSTNLGVIASLACGLFWSISVIYFKKLGDRVHPYMMNFCKCFTASCLLISTLLILGKDVSIDIYNSEHLILLLSGALGIGIADIFVLKSINLIGASRFAIVECSYSPSIIICAIFWLGEQLAAIQILGMMAILASLVLITKKPRKQSPQLQHQLTVKILLKGVAIGVAGILLMSVSIVGAKPTLERTDLLYAVTVRMIAGTIATFPMIFFIPSGLKNQCITLYKEVPFHQLFLAITMSSYFGMISWVAGFKYTDASIASVLNQTSTVMTVLMAAFFLAEPLTPRKIIATCLAFGGVLLVNYG